MTSLGNPVAGIIRPPGSPLILGNPRVTCSFDCHEARNPPTQGIDIGDGTCGEPVLAMTTGVISKIVPGKLGSTASWDASIFRIKRPDGLELGVAHLRIKAGFVVGQSIVEGTQIGTVDKIGATACHVHGGCKDPSGNELDWWPLLRQNGATEEETDMDPSFSPKPNSTVTVNKNARHRLAPTTADPANIAIAFDPGGPLGFPLMGTVVGVPPPNDPGNAIWYAYWRPETKKVYYLHTSTCGPETPWEAGYSDADLNDAKKTAARAVANAAATQANQYP